jgi:hypothetical protein
MLTKKVDGVQVELTADEELAFLASQRGTLGKQKSGKLGDLSELSRLARTSGITFKGMSINTDIESMTLLQSLETKESAISFKSGRGEFQILSVAEQQELRETLYDNIQAIFANEEDLTTQILAVGSNDDDALSDADKDALDAIDLNSGWPAV